MPMLMMLQSGFTTMATPVSGSHTHTNKINNWRQGYSNKRSKSLDLDLDLLPDEIKLCYGFFILFHGKATECVNSVDVMGELQIISGKLILLINTLIDSVRRSFLWFRKM